VLGNSRFICTSILIGSFAVVACKFIGGYLSVSLLFNIYGFLSGSKFVIEQKLMFRAVPVKLF